MNIKEIREKAYATNASKEDQKAYKQMRKKLDFSWTPTLKLSIDGKFVDQYTFLDEEYYTLSKDKQKKRNKIILMNFQLGSIKSIKIIRKD